MGAQAPQCDMIKCACFKILMLRWVYYYETWMIKLVFSLIYAVKTNVSGGTQT